MSKYTVVAIETLILALHARQALGLRWRWFWTFSQNQMPHCRVGATGPSVLTSYSIIISIENTRWHFLPQSFQFEVRHMALIPNKHDSELQDSFTILHWNIVLGIDSKYNSTVQLSGVTLGSIKRSLINEIKLDKKCLPKVQVWLSSQ